MNLHDIAGPVIGVINPPVKFTVKRSEGYTTAADGTRTPYYRSYDLMVQLQSMSSKELQHMNNMNIGGTMRKAYLDGVWQAVDRRTGGGGDLFIDEDGDTWLVASVMEAWPAWTAVVLVKQVKA